MCAPLITLSGLLADSNGRAPYAIRPKLRRAVHFFVKCDNLWSAPGHDEQDLEVVLNTVPFAQVRTATHIWGFSRTTWSDNEDSNMEAKSCSSEMLASTEVDKGRVLLYATGARAPHQPTSRSLQHT